MGQTDRCNGCPGRPHLHARHLAVRSRDSMDELAAAAAVVLLEYYVGPDMGGVNDTRTRCE